MDEKKVSIRPVLNLSSEINNEDFQNKTLRPILKLQNDILLQVFIRFCENQKIAIFKIKNEELYDFIHIILMKNTVLRNQLLGIVMGQFTRNEYVAYSENSLEFNKRIMTMICQRIHDNLIKTKKK